MPGRRHARDGVRIGGRHFRIGSSEIARSPSPLCRPRGGVKCRRRHDVSRATVNKDQRENYRVRSEGEGRGREVEERAISSKSAFVQATRVHTYAKRSRRRTATRGLRGARGAGRDARGRLARERRVTHSLRVTYTNRRTSRAGRQLATCSLLCSHTRARINLSVSCHVQRSHSLSPAAHRHSRPTCCRRLRANPLCLPSGPLP